MSSSCRVFSKAKVQAIGLAAVLAIVASSPSRAHASTNFWWYFWAPDAVERLPCATTPPEQLAPECQEVCRRFHSVEYQIGILLGLLNAVPVASLRGCVANHGIDLAMIGLQLAGEPPVCELDDWWCMIANFGGIVACDIIQCLAGLTAWTPGVALNIACAIGQVAAEVVEYRGDLAACLAANEGAHHLPITADTTECCSCTRNEAYDAWPWVPFAGETTCNTSSWHQIVMGADPLQRRGARVIPVG